VANLALYRKYRPTTFAGIIGQEHVTVPLIQAIRNGRLNHAYLFSGPRGCGKTSSARILARSLNCAEGPTPEPCGKCESCVALAPDGPGSIDVIEIDAASHGGVDDARELRERAFFAPVSSRYKVYVIDEAHMVSSAGFNALLKLVEEPPEFVLFVFATTEPEKVLPTIRSRTHHYPFRLIPPGVMRPYLEQICQAENIKVEPAVFPLVVRAGGGSARDTLSILDQLMAGAGEEGITYAQAAALLGVTDSTLIDQMCDALAAADGAGVFDVVNKVVEAGHDPRRFASDLLERLRDLIVLNQVPDAASKGLLDVPADQLERMTAQALRLGPAELSRMADIVHDGLAQMRGATAPRLVLELICARLLLPAADTSGAALLTRLERLERRVEAGVVAAPAATGPVTAAPAQPATATPVGSPPVASPSSGTVPPAPPAAPSAPSTRAAPLASRPDTDWPQPAVPAGGGAAADARPTPHASPSGPVAAPAAASGVPVSAAGSGGPVNDAVIHQRWPQILERTKRRRVVWSLLQNVTPLTVEGDVLVLSLQHPGLLPRFSDENVLAVIRGALTEVLGGHWNVRCELAGEDRRTVRGASPRSAPTPPQPVTPPPAGMPAAPAQRTGPSSGVAAPPGGPTGGRLGWTGMSPAQAGRPDAPRASAVAPARESRNVAATGGTTGSAAPVSGSVATMPQPETRTAASVAFYEGFDPGDEPLDEPLDEKTQGTMEEQALALLKRTFGAEKIGEIEES